MFDGEKKGSWRERLHLALKWIALTSVFWILALAYVIWAVLGFPIPHH